jgi:hypothetical protein
MGSKSTYKRKQTRLRQRARRNGALGNDLSAGASASSSSIVTSNFHSPFPRTSSYVFRTSGYGSITNSSAATDANAIDLVFKANSPIIVGPAQNYPLGTLSAFGGNYPSGLYYMLGNAGGASGIYGKYQITASEIEVQVILATSTNGGPLNMVVYPSDIGNQSATTATVMELPYALRTMIPLAGTVTPVTVRNRIKTSEFFGLRRLDHEADEYVANYNSDPVNLFYWCVRLNNADATTGTYKFIYRVTVTHHIDLFDINTLSTAAPA